MVVLLGSAVRHASFVDDARRRVLHNIRLWEPERAHEEMEDPLLESYLRSTNSTDANIAIKETRAPCEKVSKSIQSSPPKTHLLLELLSGYETNHGWGGEAWLTICVLVLVLYLLLLLRTRGIGSIIYGIGYSCLSTGRSCEYPFVVDR